MNECCKKTLEELLCRDLEWKQYPDEKPADSDINKLFLIRCFLGKEGSWSRCTDIRSYWPSDWNRYPNGYVTAYQWIGPIPETQYHPLPGGGDAKPN